MTWSFLHPVKMQLKEVEHRLRSLPATENRAALFVFGNQKSGTTAIAALLGIYGGLSVTLDIIPFRVTELEKLFSGTMAFERFVKRHRYEMSKDLIKEPWFTFLYDSVIRIFSLERAIFIVRDPRDNIRSILNRLDLRGDLDRIEDKDSIPPLWQKIVDNRWMGVPRDHYVESLAERWNMACKTYSSHRESLLLVRYEDFVKDKRGCIGELAEKLGISQQRDIEDMLDHQFQPSGAPDREWNDFFGRNLDRIERICGAHMTAFDYV